MNFINHGRPGLHQTARHPKYTNRYAFATILSIILLTGCPDVKKAVDNINLVRDTIKSVSKTPPSTLFPLDPVNDVTRFPLNIPGTRAITVIDMRNGTEVEKRVIELRGWLTGVDQACNSSDDQDWRWDLELDPEWADNIGLTDLNNIIKVGNIILTSDREDRFYPNGSLYTNNIPGSSSMYTLATRPIIHMEVHPWMNEQHPGKPAPPDWKTFAGLGSCEDKLYPFNPRNPLSFQAPLKEGQYVRVVGMLVTDFAHLGSVHIAPSNYPVTVAESNEARDVKRAWGGDNYIVARWVPGANGDEPNHPARYTEVHSVDVISVLDDKHYKEYTIAVALLAQNGVFGGKTESLDFNMRPPGEKPRPDSRIKVTEIVDAGATRLSSIVEGNEQKTGAKITTLADHVRIQIKVLGEATLQGGNKGTFKAIYRVRWE